MSKEFDDWNLVKKDLHKLKQIPNFSEKDIWWVSIGKNIGIEVLGKKRNLEDLL